MPSADRVKKEIHAVLKVIQSTSFEDCLPLERGYKNLTFQAGIYALKSVDGEVLYIGKASAFRTRFQNGHQTLNQLFLDGFDPKSIRVVTVSTTARYVDYLLTIEKGLIFALQPRYNRYIPVSEVAAMQQLQTPTSGHLTEVLKYLPGAVVEALEDHADAYGLTDVQVLELAIAQFLDLNAVSFGEIEKFKGVGALKEENAILKAKLKSLGEPSADA
ncbi:GIY-YIG nuclease family protein [Pantanalinema rosaneae CENA516]|uniref:GIY-YIG nuclease family protein n=1 Tax=Pantanalinema rosaneae TaxID=1620701 RepID=UPI003D6F4443